MIPFSSAARFYAAAAAALAFLLAAASSARAVGDFQISLNPGPGLAANPEALAAFERAAQEWEAWIRSPITIYIDAELSLQDQGGNPFDSNVIGATSFTTYENYADINRDFDTVRNALASRTAATGNSILAALPTSAEVTAQTPAGTSLDRTTIGIIRANQRALGLLPTLPGGQIDVRADGVIRFNASFTFDYDRFDLNGVAPGTYDFQTAAAHEIGHLLGFLSDVDDFDNYDIDSDNLTTLDLFRFPASQVPSTLEEFRTFARALTPGVESVLTDLEVQYGMSTGVNLGDGNQAGHWKDDFLFHDGTFEINPLIGIMDPTLPPGTYEEVGPADVRAIELIGYDVVPEPASGALILSGVAVFAGLRRRR